MKDLKFATAANTASVYGLREYLGIPSNVDVDVRDVRAMVDFNVSIDVRGYGIKCIDVAMMSVKASIEWWCYTDELSTEEISILISAGGGYFGTDCIEGKVEFDSTAEPFKGWKENDEMKVGEYGYTTPNDVEFDFKRKSLTVS